MGDRRKSATSLLETLRAGDRKAWDDLVNLLSEDLYRIAARTMRGQRKDHTLRPTALLNEAWMKLRNKGEVPWKDRSHFLAAAAIAMKHILVSHERARATREKAEEAVAEEARRRLLEDTHIDFQERFMTIDQLRIALERLERQDQRACEVISVRYLGGLENEEIARTLNISVWCVRDDLRYGKAYLLREINRMKGSSG